MFRLFCKYNCVCSKIVDKIIYFPSALDTQFAHIINRKLKTKPKKEENFCFCFFIKFTLVVSSCRHKFNRKKIYVQLLLIVLFIKMYYRNYRVKKIKKIRKLRNRKYKENV